MAITLTCPRCMHKQKIDDDKADKEVPCKICHHGIKPPPAKNKTKLPAAAAAPNGASKPGVKAKLAPDEDMENAGIQSGAPRVQSAKQTAANGKKPRRAVDDDDNDDDDDDDPDDDRLRRKGRDKNRQAEKSSMGMTWIMVGGGAFVLLALMCAGAGVGIFFYMDSEVPAARRNDQIVINVPIPNQDVFQPPIVFIDPNQFNNPNPFVNPNPFNQENLDPNDPKQIDRVITLLQGPDENRNPAFSWLERADPNHPRRNQVAKLLEGMVAEQTQGPLPRHNAFFPAYFRWLTKDNLPSLIRLTDSAANAPWDNERRQKAMLAIAKMKDAAGAEAIASRLPNFFDRLNAAEALKELGPTGQNAVLKYFNHSDGAVRDMARRLIQGYNTRADVIVDQCLKDLDSIEQGRRNAALQWFSLNPAEPTRRTSVALALNKLLDDANLRNHEFLKTLEIWGTKENQPKLLTYFNHPDGGLRDPVRKLLQAQNTLPAVLIGQCITDLEALDNRRRDAAVQWFAQNPVDEKSRPEVAKAFNKAIENEGSFNNRDLGPALEKWGTSENVPKLAMILDQAKFGRGDIVKVLGKIRDANALKALAKRLGHFFDRGDVQKTLKECGAVAEPAVIEMMNTTADKDTRTECARMLGEIGTKNQSVPALQALWARYQKLPAFQQDRNFMTVAVASVNAINARMK
jgi:HEAT repeat protein